VFRLTATMVSGLALVAAMALGFAPQSAAAAGPSDVTTGTISGRVIDAQTGAGVPGVRVTPELVGGYVGGQPLEVPELTVITDANGAYRLTDVPPGSWYIAAHDPAGVYTGGWYPDVPGLRAECYYVWATPIGVTGGSTHYGIDVRTPRYARLSARIVDEAAGGSLFDELGNSPDVPVYLWRFDTRSARWVISGGFRSRLVDARMLPGRYKVQMTPVAPQYAYGWLGGDTMGESSEFVLDPGASVDASVTLSPGNTVAGVVVAPDGATPVGSARVVALAYDEVNDVWEEIRSATSSADGTYEITRLPAGPFRLGAEASGYAFTFFGGSVSPGQAVDITLDPSEETSPVTGVSIAALRPGLDVRLSRAGGAIEGTVVSDDWRPPATITVDALAYDAAQSRWRPVGGPVATGSDGRFRLLLPPGDYRVRFRRSGAATRYNGQAWWLASAPLIRVTAGGTVSGVDARLISGGVSTGSVSAKTAKYGTSARVRVVVRDWLNRSTEGIPVTLQRSTDGKTYANVATRYTGGGGADLSAVPTAKRTYFRWNFPGRIGTSPPVVVGLRADVGTPKAPKVMYRTRSYSVYGYLKPRHSKGSYPVRIYLWRKNSKGTWVPRGYVKAKAANYREYTRYSRTVRLKEKGSWRLRAFAPEDAKHLSAWSTGYDYVKVR